ncbi:MAG: hypothetical protein LBG76_04195 [Treponema sp.]|jgi:hypothetical protein|nr:hypothetical protein [Treponema sp.]
MMAVNSGKKAQVMRVVELGERKATVLEQDVVRVLIDDDGGMVPEFSSVYGKGRINAHWLPWFRGNSGAAYNDAAYGSFWKARLLYTLAGNFPCLPNFGPGHLVNEKDMPPHGWTANQPWNVVKQGIDEATGAAWVLSILESPDTLMPLSFTKIDAVIPGHPVHYTGLTVKNRGKQDQRICAGWHNTVGAPFLQGDCRISSPAQSWLTPPLGGEFDTTTRLKPEAEFDALEKAPLADGGTADVSRVSGPIGYTDFAVGAIPRTALLGWSAVVNPFLKMAYISFFPGPAHAAADDIILYFNELWMQYGGRPFSPWAPYEGGTDLTYCLGMENATSAFANGLEYSQKLGTLLGNPTTVTIQGQEEKTLRYATLFARYEEGVLDEGVHTLETSESGIIAEGAKGAFCRFKADGAFSLLKKLQQG